MYKKFHNCYEIEMNGRAFLKELIGIRFFYIIERNQAIDDKEYWLLMLRTNQCSKYNTVQCIRRVQTATN